MRYYWLTDTASDLTGGSTFSSLLAHNYTGATATNVTITHGASQTLTSFGFAAPLEPGLYGSVTGNYSVQVNVTTANSNILLSIQLDRINSAGTVQQNSSVSAEQTLTATGQYTFSFTGLSLGTFAATDRFRIRYITRNSTAMTNQSIAIQRNSQFSSALQTNVSTPFTAKFAVVT